MSESMNNFELFRIENQYRILKMSAKTKLKN